MIEQGDLVGERNYFAHKGGEFEEVHAVLVAQQGMYEAPGGVLLEGQILGGAAAGVDGQGEVEWQLRLALEVGDGLGASVFGDLKVLFVEAADDGAVLVG